MVLQIWLIFFAFQAPPLFWCKAGRKDYCTDTGREDPFGDLPPRRPATPAACGAAPLSPREKSSRWPMWPSASRRQK